MLGLIQDDRYFSVFGFSRKTQKHGTTKLYGILQVKIVWHILFYTLGRLLCADGKGWFLILDASPLEQRHARFRIAKHAHVPIRDMKNVPHNQVMSLILSNGNIQIVLDYRIWVSQKVAKKADYKKQTQLALELLAQYQFFKMPVKTIVFDNFFSAKRIVTWLNEHQYKWTTRLKSNRVVYIQGKEYRIKELNLSEGDCIQAELRGVPGVIQILSIQYQDEVVYVATNDISKDKQRLEKSYRFRWRIEEFHREAKQQLGLEYLRMRNYRALFNHVGFVCLAFSILSIVGASKNMSIGMVKRRIQDELYSTHDGIDRFSQFCAA